MRYFKASAGLCCGVMCEEAYSRVKALLTVCKCRREVLS